jgi:hypothetical protein
LRRPSEWVGRQSKNLIDRSNRSANQCASRTYKKKEKNVKTTQKKHRATTDKSTGQQPTKATQTRAKPDEKAQGNNRQKQHRPEQNQMKKTAESLNEV